MAHTRHAPQLRNVLSLGYCLYRSRTDAGRTLTSFGFAITHRSSEHGPAKVDAAQATSRRAARESTSREIPLKKMLMPTSVPITHAALDGHVLQIIAARTSVTIPSTSSHPFPATLRSWDHRMNSRTYAHEGWCHRLLG